MRVLRGKFYAQEETGIFPIITRKIASKRKRTERESNGGIGC